MRINYERNQSKNNKYYDPTTPECWAGSVNEGCFEMNGKLLFLLIGLIIGSFFGSAITAWIASGSHREKLYQDGIRQKLQNKSKFYLVKVE